MLEASFVIWCTSYLRLYLLGVFFFVYTNRECCKQISNIGKAKPRTQRWMWFFSAYNVRRRGPYVFPLKITPRTHALSRTLATMAFTSSASVGTQPVVCMGYSEQIATIGHTALRLYLHQEMTYLAPPYEFSSKERHGTTPLRPAHTNPRGVACRQHPSAPGLLRGRPPLQLLFRPIRRSPRFARRLLNVLRA